jgi:hypothetical protein
MQEKHVPPSSLKNDNWQGYLDKWIYVAEVTWVDKTCAPPYWTGLMLFCINRRYRGRCTHLMNEKMSRQEGRVAFKGQLFSAPMDWASMLEQLQSMEKKGALIALPVVGTVLATRIRIAITSGLKTVSRLLKQATVRRNVVVQLILMHGDAGQPDYQGLDMREAQERSKLLADTDGAVIPNGLASFFDDVDEADENPFMGVDKAATPMERIWSEKELAENMRRARPLLLVAQRDSDAKKEVEPSRVGAFGQLSELEFQTGSNLMDQFDSSYILLVFALSFPWCVGGPDFARRPR